MVHWSWLIVSAMLGGMVGVLFMSAIIVGAEADKSKEAEHGRKE